jgi:hypothetical protein
MSISSSRAIPIKLIRSFIMPRSGPAFPVMDTKCAHAYLRSRNSRPRFHARHHHLDHGLPATEFQPSMSVHTLFRLHRGLAAEPPKRFRDSLAKWECLEIIPEIAEVAAAIYRKVPRPATKRGFCSWRWDLLKSFFTGKEYHIPLDAPVFLAAMCLVYERPIATTEPAKYRNIKRKFSKLHVLDWSREFR